MRISVDIPVALYRRLRSKAVRDGLSVKELVLQALERELQLGSGKRGRRISFPLIPSKRTGALRIDNARIFKLIPFP